jgi:capsular polysaccharide biosynthesis protein
MPLNPGVSVRKPAPLRESALWSPEQHVHASDLERTRRVPLGVPAQVTNLRALRAKERDWRPSDYSTLPSETCQGPGYTLLENVFLTMSGMVLAGDGRIVVEHLTRLTPNQVSPVFERVLSTGANVRAAEWPVFPETIEKGILLAGVGSKHFGHLLIDFLPPLAVLDHLDVFPDWPLLMPSRRPAWMDTLIQTFGSRARKVIEVQPAISVKVKVSRLCVPWVLRQPAFHPIAGEVFDRIARAHAPSGRRLSGSASRKIYIERPPPTAPGAKRQLTNADQVRAFFVDRGFELSDRNCCRLQTRSGSSPVHGWSPARRAPDCTEQSSQNLAFRRSSFDLRTTMCSDSPPLRF